MRIRASILGLAAYVLNVANAADTNHLVITVPQPYVYNNGQQLNWTRTDNSIEVVQASLIKKDNNTVITTATLSSSDGSQRWKLGDTEGRAISRRLTFNSNSDLAGSITLDYDGVTDDYTLTPLYLQIDWSGWEGNGSSYSTLFALQGANPEPDANLTETLEQSNTNTTGVYSECKTGWGCGQSAATSAGGSGFPSNTGTPSSLNTSPAATSSAANASKGSQGLSVGAIAGIAVACGLVGLGLIGAVIWFLCFRRRRSSHAALGQNRGYASDGVGAIMADKEQLHVTDSPHSAYAADRNQLHDPQGAARGSMVGSPSVGAGTGLIRGSSHMAHGGEDAYMPYSDHTPSPGVALRGPGLEGTGPMDSQSSLPTGGARNSTPPISTRYAHLVEEGMTSVEIQRLEEEERALDMAIEDAGRTRRPQ